MTEQNKQAIRDILRSKPVLLGAIGLMVMKIIENTLFQYIDEHFTEK